MISQTHFVKSEEARRGRPRRGASSKDDFAKPIDDFLRRSRAGAETPPPKPGPKGPKAPEIAAAEAMGAALPLTRTSDLLKGVLTQNPDAEVFTIETIMRSIGEERFDANLLFIALPTLELIPDKPETAEVSAALLAGQMAIGRRKISMPQTLWEKEIPRHSLAVAIHAALPFIEAAEKIARPRFKWLGHPVSRRILGAFLFVLTATVAFPIIGFDPLQSISTFAISFGMAEGDGAAILLGVAVGVIALGVIAASNFSPRALKSKAVSWLRKLGAKLGGSILARFCDILGLARLARMLRFDWRSLLLFWRPERRTAARRAAAHPFPPPLELAPSL